MKKLFYYLSVAALLLAFNACNDDDGPQTPPPSGGEEAVEEIVKALESKPEVSQFVEILKSTDVADLEESELTVFAVKNQATAMAGGSRADALDATTIKRHIAIGSYTKAELTDGMELKSIDGGTLYITRDADDVFVNGVVIEELRGLSFSNDGLSNTGGNYLLDPTKGTPSLVKAGDGLFRQVALDEQGNQLAFLYCAEKDSAYKALELWLSERGATAKAIAGRGNKALPTGWVINENGTLSFSRSAARLFFGTSPEPRQKDTTILDTNRPNVQVWSWDEPVQYTVQQYNLKEDLKKNYKTVYNIKEGKVIQLADKTLPNIQLGNEGDASLALLSTSEPYSVSSMWEARTRSDYYTVSLETGERKLIAQADYSRFRLSPAGRYAYAYAETDSCWYTISLENGERHQLTTPQSFIAWDEENDTPDYPRAYGSAGWTDDDQAILIYDRYDLWSFDPLGQRAPQRLTTDGREKSIQYRLKQLDKEARTVATNKTQLLVGFNEKSKGYGYYEARLDKASAPKKLIAGDYMLSTIVKAQKADKVRPALRRPRFQEIGTGKPRRPSTSGLPVGYGRAGLLDLTRRTPAGRRDL